MNCLSLLVSFLLLAGVQDDARGPGHRYGLETAPERTPGAIRIASYNILNYFDDVDDPALGVSGMTRILQAVPGSLKRSLAPFASSMLMCSPSRKLNPPKR